MGSRHHQPIVSSDFYTSLLDNKSLRITVITAKGLQDFLQEEMEEILQAEFPQQDYQFESGPGFVTMEGHWPEVVLLNLKLRIGNRVLIELIKRKVRHLDDVYRAVKGLPWEKFFTYRQTIAVDSGVSDSEISAGQIVNLKIKDAICDAFRESTGQRPSVNREDPDIRIYAKIVFNQLTLSLDTSGRSLSHRGYRQGQQGAPLREVVAASLVRIAGWNQTVNAIFSQQEILSYIKRAEEQNKDPNKEIENIKSEEGKGKRTRLPQQFPLIPYFMDPMCGLGTLPIEAALVLKNIYPSLERRHFPFLSLLPALSSHLEIKKLFTDYKKKIQGQQRTKEEIKQKIIHFCQRFEEVEPSLKGLTAQMKLNRYFIKASDFKKYQVDVAFRAAEFTQVDDLIDFEVMDIRRLRNDQMAGILVVNPPYGERLMSQEETDELYKEIGDTWKKEFPHWATFILSANAQSLKKVGLRPTKKWPIYNGPLQCELRQFLIV